MRGIAARDLNIKAAKDTSTPPESSSHIDAGYRGSVDVTGTPSGTLSGGHGGSSKQSAESKAVVGSIKSGGNVNVKMTGDTRLEGTQIPSRRETPTSMPVETSRSMPRPTRGKGDPGHVLGRSGLSSSSEASSTTTAKGSAVKGDKVKAEARGRRRVPNGERSPAGDSRLQLS